MLSGGSGISPDASLLDDPAEQSGYTEWRTSSDGGREAVSHFRICGIICAACAAPIEAALRSVPGVRQAHVDVASERAQVSWSPQETRLSQLVAAVQKAGYDALPDVAASARQARAQDHRLLLWRVFVAGFCMMQIMMVATPAYFAQAGEIPADQLRLLQWAAWLLCIPVLLFSSRPFFSGFWRSVRTRRMGMDVPVALGIVVTFIASTGATFEPGGVFGAEVYFDSLSMFVFFLLTGRWLEQRARHRVASQLEGLLAHHHEAVERLDDAGGSEWVAPRQLRVGDCLRVPVGQRLLADGVLLSETTEVNEAMLTGEALPVRKVSGETLLAGSVNMGAPILLRVQRCGMDTRFSQIQSLMRSAITQKPGDVQLADRFAGPFLWAVLLLAASAAALWSFWDPSKAVWVAVAVLIVTCPCALSLATPVSLLVAAGSLAKRGVLLRRLDVLEALCKVDRVVLDKTGTLTEGHMALQAVRAFSCLDRPAHGGHTLAEREAKVVLAQAAGLAAWSGHPLSRALVDACGDTSETVGDWVAVQEHPGSGMQGQDREGRVWRLGSKSWVCSQAEVVSSISDAVELWWGHGGKALYCFDLQERLRPDAVASVARLQQGGRLVSLLSGDQAHRVDAMARRLGVASAQGSASPEDKLAAVRWMQQQGHRVLMVGDGLNDGPVLAQADVSFAFAPSSAQSNALAQVHADVVLMSGRLRDVPDALALAQRTLRIVRQNLVWAAIYNAACVPLALAGALPPWAAGLGMALSSLLVVLNALRLGAEALPASNAEQGSVTSDVSTAPPAVQVG